MRHQHESTTLSMSSWSVERDYQDVDRAKRSTKHDFETERAVNRCSSRTWQEIESTKDQTDDYRHSRRDKQTLSREDVESQE